MNSTRIFFNLRTLAKLDYAIAELAIDLLELENQPMNDLQQAYINKKKAELQIQEIQRANFVRDNQVNV